MKSSDAYFTDGNKKIFLKDYSGAKDNFNRFLEINPGMHQLTSTEALPEVN